MTMNDCSGMLTELAVGQDGIFVSKPNRHATKFNPLTLQKVSPFRRSGH